ncbi:ABC transporter substrate-binding protein [Conservatibacter flavescens]
MKKMRFLLFMILGISWSVQAEKQKITLLLDWFVNPDHAALIVAQQKGYFAENGLQVDIIEPADPSMPPKLVAAGQADIAVNYQPSLHMQVDEGLPLIRIGTLISSPLNSLVVLQSSQISHLADLKGKKVGYSISGFETALLDTMLKSVGLSGDDVEMINVNWSLSPALISGQVHAVIGSFRNFELNQLDIEKHPGKAFFPEQHGVPSYEELILVVNKDRLQAPKFKQFLTALQQASDYVRANPDEAWQVFVSYKPQELDNELNRRAWRDTLPYLSQHVGILNRQKYQEVAEFMAKHKLIKKIPNIEDYAVELVK